MVKLIKIASLNGLFSQSNPVLVGDSYQGEPGELMVGYGFFVRGETCFETVITSKVVDFYTPPEAPELIQKMSGIDKFLDCDYLIQTMNSLYALYGEVEINQN